MKRKFGIFCMVLGMGLMIGALLLSRANRQEDIVAQEAAVDVLPQLVQQIVEKTREEPELPLDVALNIPQEYLTPEDLAMTEVEVDGNLYIGYLSIPDLGLSLPIMSTWSYPQQKIAPCRYTGSIRGEDLVLMAHNFSSHFGYISQLELGDHVSFTDMDGVTSRYEVVGKDLLEPTAVEEMTSGDFDLTLFTCTYGGASRVTVYCNRVSES